MFRDKTLVRGFLAAAVLTMLAGTALADFTITYTANADPTTEGFPNTGTVAPSSTCGPLANDLGLPAWQITGQGQSSQFAYESNAFSASQTADMSNLGFSLTIVARAIQNLAPAYDSTNHVTCAGANLSFAGVRWLINLGINSSGNTVVVLPTSLDDDGPGGSIRTPGPSYTLTGNGYHTYDLVYSPATNSASLFVDGIDRIQGYSGEPDFLTSGLFWSACSGGQGNYNSVQLASSSGMPGRVKTWSGQVSGVANGTWDIGTTLDWKSGGGRPRTTKTPMAATRSSSMTVPAPAQPPWR